MVTYEYTCQSQENALKLEHSQGAEPYPQRPRTPENQSD